MFIFKFKEITISVDAERKIDAIIDFEKSYPELFHNQDFELLKVSVHIDKNRNVIKM